MTGVLVLLAALAASAALALALRWKNGRFSSTSASTDGRERLTAEQVGAPLGDRATLVQFSSSFCSPCRATRVVLLDVAAREPGVVTVEINAEEHLEMVRELGIMRTPTVLVLDASGVVVTRASGLPRRDQVMTALKLASAARQ